MAFQPLRHRILHLVLALAFLVPLAELHASQVVWFSRTLSVHQSSAGTPLDGSFTFELGAFEQGFVPTAGNTALWAEKWTTARRTAYNAQTRVFGGSFTVESNAAPFQTSNRGYIWGFSTASPTEWVLIGDPSWVWPEAGDPIAFPKQWTVAAATDIVLGQVNAAAGAPFFLRTANTVGGQLPLVTPSIWLTTNFSAAQLSDALVSGWAADPDQDALSNLVEMALGTNPLSPDRRELPDGTLKKIDGQDYLQLTFDKESSVPANYRVEVSFDKRNWNSGELFTKTLVDTPHQLVVRSTIALSLLDQQFMRLIVEID